MDVRAELSVYGVDVKRNRLTAARAEKLVDARQNSNAMKEFENK